MKIGLITAFYDERDKCNEYYLAKYLTKLGHKVFIYVSKFSLPRYGRCERIWSESEIENVIVRRLPSLGIKKKGMIFLFGLKNQIEKDEIDIIHLQEWFMLSSYQLREYAEKIVCTQRIEHLPTSIKLLMGFFGRKLLNNCKSVTALTTIARDDLIKNGIQRNINVIPNGVDTEVFYPVKGERKDDLFRILYVGRLAKDKGVDILIKACQDLQNINLTIVGSGEEERNLKLLTCDCLLQSQTDFLGKVPQSELKNFYSSHDVTIIPSLKEPFGFVTMESLACGTPVIGSDVGGMHDIIVDKVGIKVKPGSVDELKNAIMKMMTKSKELKGKKCIDYIKNNYDWKIVAKKYEEEYK